RGPAPHRAPVRTVPGRTVPEVRMILTDRFWKKVTKTEADCWEWTGALNSRGYGCVGIDSKRYLTHRVAYEALVGPIPEGLTIDHLCRNKVCCNPAHLEPVTARE